jgi:ribose-phosphate pyrophosphokinase
VKSGPPFVSWSRHADPGRGLENDRPSDRHLSDAEIKVFCGTANRPLGEEVAAELELPLGRVTIRRFEDGEIYARYEESVRGVDAFVIQPTCPPVNENLMELLVMVDALSRASAGRITAVLPYYGYARQDKRTAPRSPITGRLVADLLQSAGVDRVLALDLDADQIEGFFKIPVDHLRALPLFANYLGTRDLSDAVVVAPDDSAVKTAYRLAERLHLPLAVVFQRGQLHGTDLHAQVVGDVAGRVPVLVDRIVDTPDRMCAALDAIREQGARPEAYVCATHGVLVEGAIDAVCRDDVREIVLTNSVPIPPQKRLDKVRVLSSASLLARAMRSVHLNASISTLMS